MTWNYGDILDLIAEITPKEKPALVHGDRQISWGEFDQRTNRLARKFQDAGLEPGAKVGFYMRNCPEYTETIGACFRGRFVHVNINYRYQADEVHYIIDNSDSEVVVYSREFRDVMDQLQGRLDKVKLLIEVSEDGQVASYATPYESLVVDGDGRPLDIQRSPDDQLFIYTGGTTGMPKGVMWRTDDLYRAGLDATARVLGLPVPNNMEELKALRLEMGPAAPAIPACPLMHGTGLLNMIGNLLNGGTIVTMEDHSLNPEELFSAVDKHKVGSIALVGDAFGKPLLKHLRENPGKYDLSSIMMIGSSGVMWSLEVKQGLLEFMPQAIMRDSFGASEGLGFGGSTTTKDGGQKTAQFQIGADCKVFDENDNEVTPGSGVPGFIALKGAIPVGYYKDEEKTAKTFRVVNGVRYSIPGDWCQVEEDGSLVLLGRGSVCINSGGEKIYPEEVEESLKTHDVVEDALVIGVPDDKWGQAVVGVVHVSDESAFDEGALREHVKGQLAHYKAPKKILIGRLPFRAPNGKADYKGVTNFALSELGLS